ncbi:uncharacterized protein BCR38DRAFT_489830 [Pseudomassariella vexata]|uniref:F-box domain-containing protein n=1 Tax=Pseudomassariella vexata TaxID=1141098 RepID=A0A1Y2DFC1_9PEZI|nr:uncharacterized protein BCR38DRAFT_489830 [Pseudomassariella vexata]ORY57836.1 hypothetical protein BCR38DRAFT_489830 [Pseudomassariella vexata]
MEPKDEAEDDAHGRQISTFNYYIVGMLTRLSTIIPVFGQRFKDEGDRKERWSMSSIHAASSLTGGRRAFDSVRFKIRHSKRIESLMDRLAMFRFSSSRSDDSHDGQDECDSQLLTDDSRELKMKTLVKVARDAESVISSSSTDSASLVSMPHPGTPSKLLELPQELFDEITSYLGPANIVVLALVNKELLGRFIRTCPPSPSLPTPGPNAGPLTQASQWKALGDFIKRADGAKAKSRGTLLSLLDLDLVDLVYCYKCKKMHDPFVTFIDRAYAPKKSSRCVDYGADHHMPPRATRKLLRAITKRRKRGAPYKDLIPQVNNTVTTYRNGIMVQASLRMRYRGDLLLLRRQQIVSSIDKTSLALWVFRQQLRDQALPSQAAMTSPKVHKICNHIIWNEKYISLLQAMTDPLCKCKENHSGPASLPLHSPACFSRAPYDASKDNNHIVGKQFDAISRELKHLPDDANATTARLGDVFGCTQCTTDFQMDVVALPDPFGWGFVLTTWLDLGPVDFCAKWDSHRDARPGRLYGRQPPHGDICSSFENLSDETQYRPQISEINLERLTNYGWGPRAAKGTDRYITWSSGHSADPVTGRFLDPDPLEPDDLEGDSLAV